jgi:hypothetical protein
VKLSARPVPWLLPRLAFGGFRLPAEVVMVAVRWYMATACRTAMWRSCCPNAVSRSITQASSRRYPGGLGGQQTQRISARSWTTLRPTYSSGCLMLPGSTRAMERTARSAVSDQPSRSGAHAVGDCSGRGFAAVAFSSPPCRPARAPARSQSLRCQDRWASHGQ